MTFEINHYGAWTTDSICQWNFNQENILEIKFDYLMENFDTTFSSIFAHLSLTSKQQKKAMSIASKHDLNRKSDSEIQKMAHVSSAKSSKWLQYFEPSHKELFKQKFGDILIELGYESDMNW